jgi:hypothetical protein
VEAVVDLLVLMTMAAAVAVQVVFLVDGLKHLQTTRQQLAQVVQAALVATKVAVLVVEQVSMVFMLEVAVAETAAVLEELELLVAQAAAVESTLAQVVLLLIIF